MRRSGRRVASLLLTTLATVAAGCRDVEPPAASPRADTSTGAAVHIVDASGTTVTLGHLPSRIISLVPSASETLVALGAADRLVGRTDFDTATVVAGLPSVGGGLNPSMEVVLSLRPDLVIRFAGNTDSETPGRLDAAGIPHVAVRPERILEVQDMIRVLGVIAGAEAKADDIVAANTRTMAAIRAQVEGLDPVRAVFSLGGDPPFVAGPDSFVGELLSLAGGENVFADITRAWAAVSPETFLDRAPDVVIVLTGTNIDRRLVDRLTVRTVSGVVQLPGHRLAEAALEIARALRPTVFR